MAAAGADAVIWAAGSGWVRREGWRTPSELAGFLAGDDDALGQSVLVVGASKAALSLARAAARRGRRVVLASPADVVAPELGLPGRFRAVADARDEGVDIRFGRAIDATDRGDYDDTVLVERAPAVVPDLGVPVEAVGDAAGTEGLAPAMAAARALALRT